MQRPKRVNLTAFAFVLLKFVRWETQNYAPLYNAALQTTTQTLRATKYSIESTYSDFPCDLKVNRSKLALINRPWKCKKGKDRPLVHSRKWLWQALFPAVTVTVVRDRKIRTALRTKQIAGFVTVPSWKKIKPFNFILQFLRRTLRIC